MHFVKDFIIFKRKFSHELEKEVKSAFSVVENYMECNMPGLRDGTIKAVMPTETQIQISRFASSGCAVVYVWHRKEKVFVYNYDKTKDIVSVTIFRPGEWQRHFKTLTAGYNN